MSTTQERIDDAVGGEVDHLRAILERQRAAYTAEGPPDVAVRRNRIDRLLALVLDNADEFIDAMETDFGSRPKTGSLFTEVLGMISVIEHTRSHVPQWMRATKLMLGARLVGLKAEVQPSPLGVVGIIGPWNYPLQLVVLPASAAFAAGNRVMIKMSRDHAQHCGADEVHGAQVLRPERTRHRHGRSRSLRGFLAAAVRPPVLHRFACGRLTGAAGRRAEPRPCHAGVGRQESGGGVAGCRHQPIGCAHRPGANDQRGTGVCLPRLCLRAP